MVTLVVIVIVSMVVIASSDDDNEPFFSKNSPERSPSAPTCFKGFIFSSKLNSKGIPFGMPTLEISSDVKLSICFTIPLSELP